MWWRSIGLALGTASALGLARFAYGLFVPAMSDRLHWTMAEAGGLTTANGVGYLLGAALTTVITRRTGLTAAFRAGMILTAASLAGTAVSGVYPVLIAARAVGGFSGALVFISGAALAARLAGVTASVAPITVYFCGAGFGVALSGGVVPLLLDHHPGRWALGWWTLACIAALATLGSWWAARTHRGRGAQVSAQATGRHRLPGQWRLACAYLLFGTGYIAYITFLSAYLAARQAPVALVCLTWMLIGLSAIAAPVFWSRPIATWAGTRALGTLLAGVAVAAVVPLLGLTLLTVSVSALLFGSAFMMVPAAVTAFVSTTQPVGDATGALATLTVMFAAGQSAGPWVAGLLADRTNTGAVLGWAAVLCAAAALLAITQPAARVFRLGDRRPASPAAGTRRWLRQAPPRC